MDKKQAILVISILLILVGVMTTAALMGQQKVRSGLGGTAKRFTAKAGTTRENARFLRGKRAPTARSSRNAPSGKQKRPGEWGEPDYDITSVTTGDPAELEATPEATAVRSVMEQLESGSNLESVLNALRETPGDLDECAALTRLGEVYGQFEPPKTEQAQKAFDRALAVAGNSEERALILAAAAEQYLDAGDIDAARLRIDMGLAGLEGVTPAQLRLNVLLARSHEEQGEVARAKELYAASVNDALLLASGDTASPEVTDMLRLAGTRLAWIYHREGRNGEAEALAKRVRPVLEAAADQASSGD